MLKFFLFLALSCLISFSAFPQKVNGIINSASANSSSLKYSLGPFLNLRTAEVIITDLGDAEIENDVLVYPNPATTVLNLKSVTPVSQIVMFDQGGREIRNFTLEGDKIQITELRSGIYLLHITLESKPEPTVIKFIKQ